MKAPRFFQKKTNASSAEAVKKFLIICASSLGDIILTTPVIRCLRKKYPDAVIHYLTQKKFAAVLQVNPYVNKVMGVESSVTELSLQSEAEKYDGIIDLQHDADTMQLKSLFPNIPFYSFPDLNFKKWLYIHFKINLMPHKHIVDRLMEAVTKLGVVNDGLGLDFFIPENDEIKKDDIPFSHLQGYIAIIINAEHNTQKLPVKKMQELIAKIEYPVILLGTEDDTTNGEEIAQFDDIKIYNACGKFSLNETADIIRNATLVISHDTGLMQVAAAFKKNVLSVWGSNVPSFGATPYKTMFDVFQVNKLSCRPCSVSGFESCPKGHFKCMNRQPLETIAGRALSLVKK